MGSGDADGAGADDEHLSRTELARALELARKDVAALSHALAHDLRAPLRGMRGFADLVLETYGDSLDAEGQDWLREIADNANRMATQIDALVALTRVASARLCREPVDLTALAIASAETLAARHPERKVDLAVRPGLLASADRSLLAVVIDHLLANAWKFTSKVSRARVEVGAVDTPHGPAFFVRDNGAGLDMAYASKLFAPFQRLHLVSEFPGLGVGLATVERIIHRHGGRVWVLGSVAEGATVSFTLRAAAGEPSGDEGPTSP